MNVGFYTHAAAAFLFFPAMLVAQALFCPCHVVGRNAKAVGEQYWTWCLADAVVRVCLVHVNCALHMFIRQKIRAEKGIEVWNEISSRDLVLTFSGMADTFVYSIGVYSLR